ncbi:MAG: hypothetical protein CVU05_11455 [Bacteroidetes bacterium HGW-Bacteroidetes-21]|nr:MAG: hypothetical protein CVU05_11455 [Bacteroidetes bacterium HGW-Bacteroidetes-21]
MICTANVFGQSAGNVIYNNTSIVNPQRFNVSLNQFNDYSATLSSEVLMNVPASSFSVIFSTTQNGITAEQTDSLMNYRLNLAIEKLRKLGIKKNEIHIDVISFVPSYSMRLEEKKFSRTANEIPIGFQMKKNVHVLFFNHDMLSEIVSIMSESEIFDIVKVDYNLDNLKQYFDTLRSTAIAILKSKEKDYTKMGLNVEIENMYDGFNAVYPLERYASYTAYYTGSSIEEIKVAKKKKEEARKNVVINGNNTTVNINVKKDENEDDTEFIVKYADKNKTIYYNRIPYNQFDQILNADFTEPRIQLVYTLKAKYKVENLEKRLEAKRLIKEKEDEKGKKKHRN